MDDALPEITAQTIVAIVGDRDKRQAANIAGFVGVMPRVFAAAQITTRLRAAHFLAQIAHESDRFCAVTEYASGAAYEGRADLGNTEPGDGVRFKGRGLIQVTGRANYAEFQASAAWHAEMMGVPAPNFLARPHLVAKFPWAGLCASWFWVRRNLNDPADQDNLIVVTRRINGGRNGLDDRADLLGDAKAALAAISIDPATGAVARGDRGDRVEEMQALLRVAGYPVTVDGRFGPGTETAVKIFQRRAGLEVDGIAGEKTFAALALAQPLSQRSTSHE
jgi:putative chitinase